MHNNSTTRSYHHFTEKEQRFIRRWYATARTCCIAHILGLTTAQVKKFAERNRRDRDKNIDKVWNKTERKQHEINVMNHAHRGKPK